MSRCNYEALNRSRRTSLDLLGRDRKKRTTTVIMGLVGDVVAIRIRAGRVLQRTRESLTHKNTLAAICPDLTWWAGLLGGEPLTATMPLSWARL